MTTEYFHTIPKHSGSTPTPKHRTLVPEFVPSSTLTEDATFATSNQKTHQNEQESAFSVEWQRRRWRNG